MCLVDRTANTDPVPLNMTLTAGYAQNPCVNMGVPIGSRATKVTYCNSCGDDVHVTITQYCSCAHTSSDVSIPLPDLYAMSRQYQPCNSGLQENKVLLDTIKALRLSGWYYERSLDWQGAKALLKNASVGSFLLRNSADKNYIFTLSVQTEKGPTSVRLHFDHGYFRLDCQKSLAKYLPRFRGVVDLVQYYRREGASSPVEGTIWVDLEGFTHSRVLLKKPLRAEPPSLKHAARLVIHKNLDSNPLTPKLWTAPKHRLLPLPKSLLTYLDEYPYSV